MTDDPLVDVAVRVYADFARHVTLARVLAVIARCRDEVDAPIAAALPKPIERAARQRLADSLAHRHDLMRTDNSTSSETAAR